MPPPPAGPIAPYHVYVAAVNDSGGSPVSGAQFVLKNTTKATQAPAIISNETNSNIVLNVADAGAWDNGDGLELDVSFGGEDATAPTTIDTATFPLGRDMGTISLVAGTNDAAMTLSQSMGVAQSTSKIVDAALTLSQAVGDSDSGQANMSAGVTLAEFLELMQDPDGSASVAMTLSQSMGVSQSTDGSSSAAMTLSQVLAIAETGQAATSAALTLSQFVGMRDGSPIEDSVALGIVQSVSFTATAIIVGIITPPGRTVYIKAETSMS